MLCLIICLFVLLNIFVVNCPPGSQGVTGSTCAQCTFDTFQDQQGQAACKPCPNGQGTFSTGAMQCAGENNCIYIYDIRLSFLTI